MGQAFGRRHRAEDGADTRTASLAGLAAVLFIAVLALVVVRKLQVRCLDEECRLSGQPGCEHALDRLRVSRMFAGPPWSVVSKSL